MNRRGFLTGVTGMLAAPAIVRVGSIMPVRAEAMIRLPVAWHYNIALDEIVCYVTLKRTDREHICYAERVGSTEGSRLPPGGIVGEAHGSRLVTRRWRDEMLARRVDGPSS